MLPLCDAVYTYSADVFLLNWHTYPWLHILTQQSANLERHYVRPSGKRRPGVGVLLLCKSRSGRARGVTFTLSTTLHFDEGWLAACRCVRLPLFDR